jgi:hypothetical protein
MLNGCVQFDDVEVKPSKSINSNFAVFCVLSPINDSNFVSINYLNKIGDIVNNKSINSEIEKVVITNLRNGKLATLQIKKQSFGVFYTTKNVLPIVENNTYRLEVKLKYGKIIYSTNANWQSRRHDFSCHSCFKRSRFDSCRRHANQRKTNETF